MTDATLHPEPAASVSPMLPRIDLSKLDDKHLGQYRHPNERRALVGVAFATVLVFVGLWFAQSILGNLLNYLPIPMLRPLVDLLHPARIGPVILALIVLMWIVDVAGQTSRAWQLVAQAVEITPTTFPQLAPIVDDLRGRFDLPQTRVYVSRDAPPKGYTIGIREPFAIVFSSISVGSLTSDEFKFTLGREMGSIKLGHTRMATLLGNRRMSLPEPLNFLLKFRSTLFGTYHHGQELSCDRIGVVATRDVRPAISTLIKQDFGTVRGAKIDVKSLSTQSQEMERGISGKALRAAMLFNSQPWAVARLYELVNWAGEPTPAPASAPAAPPPPTPAQSAAAAAASAAAAAASAAEAAACAAAAAAAVAAITGAGPEPMTPVAAPDEAAPSTPSRDTPADGSPTVEAGPSPVSSATVTTGGSGAPDPAGPSAPPGGDAQVAPAGVETTAQSTGSWSRSDTNLPSVAEASPVSQVPRPGPASPSTPSTAGGA